MRDAEMQIREMEPRDHAETGALAEEAGLFPAEMLPGLAEAEGALFYVAEAGGRVAGLAYAAPEMLTEGTWNLRAIAVAEELRGRAAGRALMQAAEAGAKAAAGRIMIVDTSSGPDFAGARAFYPALGYEAEAVIRDYWSDGDDKVTFRKRL